jgi:hypothetical protein
VALSRHHHHSCLGTYHQCHHCTTRQPPLRFQQLR